MLLARKSQEEWEGEFLIFFFLVPYCSGLSDRIYNLLKVVVHIPIQFFTFLLSPEPQILNVPMSATHSAPLNLHLPSTGKNSYGSYEFVRGGLTEAPNQENVPIEKKLPFKLDTINYEMHNPTNIQKIRLGPHFQG